jgi:hypothetical protein
MAALSYLQLILERCHKQAFRSYGLLDLFNGDNILSLLHSRGSAWAIFRNVNFHALIRVDALRPYNWVTTDAYLAKLGRSQPHNYALNDIQASLTNHDLSRGCRYLRRSDFQQHLLLRNQRHRRSPELFREVLLELHAHVCHLLHSKQS